MNRFQGQNSRKRAVSGVPCKQLNTRMAIFVPVSEFIWVRGGRIKKLIVVDDKKVAVWSTFGA